MQLKLAHIFIRVLVFVVKPERKFTLKVIRRNGLELRDVMESSGHVSRKAMDWENNQCTPSSLQSRLQVYIIHVIIFDSSELLPNPRAIKVRLFSCKSLQE